MEIGVTVSLLEEPSFTGQSGSDNSRVIASFGPPFGGEVIGGGVGMFDIAASIRAKSSSVNSERSYPPYESSESDMVVVK